MELVLFVTLGSSLALAGWSAMSLFHVKDTVDDLAKTEAAESILDAFKSEAEQSLANPRLPPELFEFLHRFWTSIEEEDTAAVYFSNVHTAALALPSVGGTRLYRLVTDLDRTDPESAEHLLCTVRLGLTWFFLRWSELSTDVVQAMAELDGGAAKDLQVAFDLCAAGAIEIQGLEAA